MFERKEIAKGIVREGNVVEVDGSVLMANKVEMFPIIMKTISELQPDDIMIVTSTFKPIPLIWAMQRKGYAEAVEELGPDNFRTTFTRKEDNQPKADNSNSSLVGE